MKAINISSLTVEEFKALSLVIDGESREIRYLGKGKVVIRYKPTIYSFTYNRYGVIDGIDTLRLRTTKIFSELLNKNGVNHSYIDSNDKWVLSHIIQQPKINGNYCFRPDDLSKDELSKLSMATPIEVIVKRSHVGTPKHRYYGMDNYHVRASHPKFSHYAIKVDRDYPELIVRFDWRNPLFSPDNRRLADEVLPESMADLFINVTAAKATALKAYNIISDFLLPKGIICSDICFFITEDGNTIYSEISQDCARFKHIKVGPVDKDVWRNGNSPTSVYNKWKYLFNLIQYK